MLEGINYRGKEANKTVRMVGKIKTMENTF